MNITTASGRGTCKICNKKIEKGQKQLLLRVAEGKYVADARHCKPCSSWLLESALNNLLSAREV